MMTCTTTEWWMKQKTSSVYAQHFRFTSSLSKHRWTHQIQTPLSLSLSLHPNFFLTIIIIIFHSPDKKIKVLFIEFMLLMIWDLLLSSSLFFSFFSLGLRVNGVKTHRYIKHMANRNGESSSQPSQVQTQQQQQNNAHEQDQEHHVRHSHLRFFFSRSILVCFILRS